jgi:DNA-binding NtrC family response regulator
MNILVVHDERAIADQIANILAGQGHRALALYTSVEALQHLRHLWFDLVILNESSAGLAERILGKLIHPEVMLLEAPNTLENLAIKVQEVEHRLELEWQEALEFLQSGDGESEPLSHTSSLD